MAISSFDILKRMSVDNLDIRLSTSENLRNMNAVHKGKDTDITIGVAGNVIGAVMNNELHLCLLIWNKEQFQATKAKMEAETAWLPLTSDIKLEVGKRYLLYCDSTPHDSSFQDGSVELIRWEENGAYLIQGWTHYQPVTVP
jgi:hypothetical protein